MEIVVKNVITEFVEIHSCANNILYNLVIHLLIRVLQIMDMYGNIATYDEYVQDAKDGTNIYFGNMKGNRHLDIDFTTWQSKHPNY